MSEQQAGKSGAPIENAVDQEAASGGEPGGGVVHWLANNATLLLCLTTLIWGGNAIAGKFAVGHVSPLLLTLLRWLIASVILLFFAMPHIRRDWIEIRKNALYIFVMGASGFAIFNAFLYTALKYTTAINVTILQAGMPLFVFLFSYLAFRIPTRLGQAVGYSLTLVGVLLVASRGDLTSLLDLNFNRGDVIMTGAVILYGGYSAALKAKPDMHWMSFVSMLSLSAFVVSIPMVAYEATTSAWIYPVTLQGWMVVAYAGLLPSLVAQALFIRGVQLLGGNTAGLFFNLVPIFGALLAVVLLGEAFQPYHAVAMVLVVGGVLLAQMLVSKTPNA